MSDYRKPRTSNINDILTWYNNGELDYSPKYQRNPVWNTKAKSYLIDSIIRGLPIPPIFLKENIDIRLNKTMRQVIDGQQRIRTIIEFRNNEFKILKEHNKDFKNYSYSDLPNDIKKNFLGFEISFEIITTEQDAIIYDMFARLNTNNKVLNAQEIRNAKYWGYFKVFAYKLAKETKQMFIDLGTFNDTQFARMADVEFVSSLVILCIDGIITETPKILNGYYHKYDEVFDEILLIEKRYSSIINDIMKLFSDYNYSTEYFHRKVFFFTLFAVLFHSKYGLKSLDLPKYPKIKGDKKFISFVDRLSNFELKLNEVVDLESDVKQEYKPFIIFHSLHRTRTTNLKERRERVKILNEYLLK